MIAIVILVSVVLISKYSAPIEQIACTMEAKLCPDGSAVGRIGPNCEFAECPTANPIGHYGDD